MVGQPVDSARRPSGLNLTATRGKRRMSRCQARRLRVNSVAETRGDKPAILIVEDDELLRELLLNVLSGEGIRSSAPTTGAQALSELRTTPFSTDAAGCVAAGHERPGGARRGQQAARFAAGDRHDQRQNTRNIAASHFASGPFDYIAKPFEVSAILELAQSTLNSSDVPDIQVLSARPNWVELLVPCDLQAAGRMCPLHILWLAYRAFATVSGSLLSKSILTAPVGFVAHVCT